MAVENIEIRIRSTGAREAAGNVNRIGRAGRTAARSIRALDTAVVGIFGAAAARQGARVVDNFTQIQNRLRLITRDEGDLANLTQLVFEQSQRTRSEFEAQASLVSRISRSAGELGASQAQVLQVSEAVAQSFAVSGASAQETAAASIQLGQALASGVLRGDELNSILENNARLAGSIASGIGISTGRLRELGAEGRLTSRAVFEAILGDVERLNSEFEQLAPTIEQGFTQAANAITVIIGDLDIGGSTGQFFASIATSITDARVSIVSFVGEARLFTQSLFFSIEEFLIRIRQAILFVETKFGDLTESAGNLGRSTAEAVREFFGIEQSAEGAAEAAQRAAEQAERQRRIAEEQAKLAAELALLESARGDGLKRNADELRRQVVALQELIRGATPDEDAGPEGPRTEDITAFSKLVTGSLDDIAKLQDELAEAERLAAEIGGETDFLFVEQLRAKLAEATAEADGTSANLEAARAIVEQTTTEVEALERTLEQARFLADEGFFNGIADAEEIIERLKEQLKEARDSAAETFFDIDEIAKQAARSMQDALADFLFDPFQDGLDGMVAGALNAFRRIAAEAAAAKIFDLIGAAAGAGSFGPVGTFVAGLFQQRQAGGMSEFGRPQIVGEAGPEVFVPGANGRVENNISVGAPAAPIVIVEQDPEAVVRAISTTRGAAEILRVVAQDPEAFRQVLNS